MAMKDPYRVLGVDKSADNDTIRKAFKKLARKYHPDINQEAGAEERFKEINNAYGIVGDETKRKNWDRFGEASTRPGFDPDLAARYGRAGTQGFDFSGGGSPDMDDFISSLFGGNRGAARPRRTRGVDQRASLQVDLLDAVRGADREIQVPRQDGSRDRIKVQIPAGVQDGQKLRLRGHGLPPPNGGPCGDLHLEITVRPHPVLRRVDDDLEMDVPLTILEAMQGTVVTVPTPTGDVKVKIPAGAQPGQRLRIKGRGMQKRIPGHLYLVLQPTPPPSTDPDVLAAAQRLEEAYLAPVRANLRL